MKEINSIDLWTEQMINHEECFSGAFVDGFDGNNIPFDSFKVIRNCNCVIFANNPSVNVSNKHNAIVFYKNNQPVRLLVINRETNVDKCIEIALNQVYNGVKLCDLFEKLGIKRKELDMKKEPILFGNISKEMDIGSCDRLTLLDSMLSGSYTENDTDYGKDNIDNDFHYDPTLGLIYILDTDEERFTILHSGAFVNSSNTRVIPLQCDGLNTLRIGYDFLVDGATVNPNKKK